MMNKLKSKFRSRRGETFVEILIAILVVAFGAMLIATMYSSAMKMNLEAAKEDATYYEALSEMEQMDSTPKSTGKATINDSEEGKSISIDIYGNESNTAYKRHH